MNRLVLIGMTGFLLTGCATPAELAGPTHTSAATILLDKVARPRAQASATQIGDSVRLDIQATDMDPGIYGVHLHSTGRCDAPDFTSAGPHWNPTGALHGKNNPAGMHKGDLPNLTVGGDRRGKLEYTLVNAGLRAGQMPILDADGASLVIHATADDYRTDPSGNSGARIACGVLG